MSPLVGATSPGRPAQLPSWPDFLPLSYLSRQKWQSACTRRGGPVGISWHRLRRSAMSRVCSALMREPASFGITRVRPRNLCRALDNFAKACSLCRGTLNRSGCVIVLNPCAESYVTVVDISCAVGPAVGAAVGRWYFQMWMVRRTGIAQKRHSFPKCWRVGSA